MENSAIQAVEGEIVDSPAKTLPDLPAALRGRLAEAITQDWEEIIGAQKELARGVFVKEYIKDPKTGDLITDSMGIPQMKPVYRKAPDRDAGQYLINQVIGKPKENTVLEGKVNLIFDL